MPTRLYQDYIKVDPNFIPVFSSNWDRVYPDKWQSFYPHDSFKTILTGVVQMLEKSSATKGMPQWMSGAYGTGKTYASFTIKHILEDQLESVEPYFTQNHMEALWARVKGIRAKGNILVVHKSSSAGIDSPNKLFNAITASVREALISRDYTYLGSASRYDKVLSILKDPNSSFYFAGAFNKYKARFTEYPAPEDVIADLEELPQEDALDLLDTVIQIAEEENYNWSSTPEEVINWLEDVRIGNDLYAIVMMWDEFTEFFKNNQNNITGLQEIAHAAPRIRFYFFLITHSDVNQLIADQNARKIMQARFVSNQLRLGENTAFTLLGQALRHVTDLQQEWDGVVDTLWASVKRDSVDHIKTKDSSLLDTDFKNLFPMHPYTSYLLKFIAQDISSNQRTMFQFLSGDYSGNETDRTNFKWFIEHFGFDYGAWNLLTPDYLWDYFFFADNVDLDGSFMEAISHYNNFESVCGIGESGDNCRRVLKVALLLSALHTKNGSVSRSGVTSLLRPTAQNIKACFVGTPLENRVTEFLEVFVKKGVLGSVEDFNDTLYVITSVAIDKDRMDKMKEDVRTEFPFEKIIQDSTYGITKQFAPNGFMAERCDVTVITPSTARNAAIKYTVETNKIAVFYLFAKNEAEQGKTADAIRCVFTEISERCIVVDFTSLPFTEERYERFVESKAKEKYFKSSPNQRDQMNYAKKSCEATVNEWTRALVTVALRVYSKPMESAVISGGTNLRKKLTEMNTNFYGCGLEEISLNDKLFASSGFKDVVGKIAMGKESIPNNYSYLKNISTVLEHDGIWSNPEYWKAQPEHVVSKMKLAVEDIIRKGFDNNSMVCVSDIWKALTLPPFGLLPCTGAVFLMAFLLKDYADTNYYKQDVNNNTVSLNYSDLSELIYGVIKGLPKAKDQYIVRQKPAHTSFCRITGEIFKIAKDKRNSISDISKNLNINLTNNVYPLWSLASYVDEEMDEHPMHDELIQTIQLLCEFVNPEQLITRDKTKVAEEINDLYMKTPGIDVVLSSIVPSECRKAGMIYYIALQKPELAMLTAKLKVDSNEYLAMLTQKLSSDSSYLWQKGDIDHQIDNLYVDFRLIDAINGVLATPQRRYQEAQEGLVEKLNYIKVPDAMIEEYHSSLKPILQQFYAIRNNAVTDKSAAANLIVGMTGDFLSFFNNQFETFAEAIKLKVDSRVTSEELEHLFSNVPSGILFKKVDEFTLTMKQELEKFRKNQKIRKLFTSWKTKMSTNSPAEWSKVNGIPILCMFPDDTTTAQQVFGALNRTLNLPSEEAIDHAIQFINSSKLDILSDSAKCTSDFIQYFCDEYAYVVEDADILRDTLREVAGNDVYEWYSKKAQCRSALCEMATNRYKIKYRAKAKERVHTLTAEQAQRYLESLIENDPLLGIRILQEK